MDKDPKSLSSALVQLIKCRYFIRMKVFIIILFLVIGVHTLALAQQSCGRPAGQAAQLGAIATACAESVCKNSGSENKKFGPVEDSVARVFSEPFADLKKEMQQYADKAPCAEGCKSTVVSKAQFNIQPVKTLEPPPCPQGLKPYDIKKIFTGNQCSQLRSEAEGWVKEVVMGNNDEGRKLSEQCPSECSFYTTQEIDTTNTEGGNCTVLVRLNIKFGKKRSGFDYRLGAEIQKKWECQPK